MVRISLGLATNPSSQNSDNIYGDSCETDINLDFRVKIFVQKFLLTFFTKCTPNLLKISTMVLVIHGFSPLDTEPQFKEKSSNSIKVSFNVVRWPDAAVDQSDLPPEVEIVYQAMLIPLSMSKL